MTQAYPLQWPEGWPRTDWAKRVSGNRFNTTFDRARRQLHEELRMLGAKNVVISSWLPLKKDGQPYSETARRKIDDPGCAVYFTLRGKQMVLARDAFDTAHDNLRSIGLSVEGLRQMERHGGAHMMERAFQGFAAIEPPRDWRRILGFDGEPKPPLGRVEDAYRKMARNSHPDVPGGSSALMAELNEAISRAREELRQ